MDFIPSIQEVERFAKAGYSIIPVGVEFPWDTVTTVEAFRRLRHGAHHSFLLESAAGGETVGRYSFMGANPFATLVCQDGELIYEGDDESVRERPEDPMRRVGEWLNRLRSPDIERLPPFQGGAVGYVGYDSVRFLERVSVPAEKTNCADLHLMFFRNVVAVDRLKHRLYIMSHIRPDRESIADGMKRARQEIEEMRQRLFSRQVLNDPLDPRLLQGTPELEVDAWLGEEKYCAGVKEIKQHIKKGDIFQGVLSDSFKFKLKVDPYQVYRALRMINPSPYLFFLSLGEETLLGASPEMLVRAEKGMVATCPIAGTRPRGADEKEDEQLAKNLMASVKERAEHLMLVDLGRNDIGRVSQLGTVRVKDFMHIQKFSHVMHLVSEVEGKLRKDLSAWDAFCSCFPAGTLTGAPKIRAMEIISNQEKRRRGFYGGAVIYHDFSGNLNSCITIRSLHVRNGEAQIQAGAGVVADSNPKREYEEVLNKSKAVMKAVAAAMAVEGADA